MLSAEYIVLLAVLTVPLIALHRQALEFVFAFGQVSAIVLGSPW